MSGEDVAAPCAMPGCEEPATGTAEGDPVCRKHLDEVARACGHEGLVETPEERLARLRREGERASEAGPFWAMSASERAVCGAALERGWVPGEGEEWAAALDCLVQRGDGARAEVARLRGPFGDLAVASGSRDAANLACGRLRAERDEARDLVRLGAKYATEDRAVTPGLTRLARWVSDATEAVNRWGPP